MYKKQLFVFIFLFYTGFACAELPGVMHWDVNQDFNRVYREVYRALEDHQFFVIFEANIGRNLRGYAARWGDNYNRNGLDEIRSMVFCNIGYTNQLSNQDPGMLSLCPLHLTIYQKGPTTTVLFNRPTYIGQGSAAMPLLKEIETGVSAAVESGINAATGRLGFPPEGKGRNIGNQHEPDQHQ
jgi:uncharacterized protein (DUF302 family)